MSYPEQRNLNLIWSSEGEKATPANTKYRRGWVVELPTFQNFNGMLHDIDYNIWYAATNPTFKWEPDIAYNYNSTVTHLGRTYEAIEGTDISFGVGNLPIENNLNFNPKTDYDNNGQIWTQGTKFGRIYHYNIPIPTVTSGGYEEIKLNTNLGVVIGDIHKQPNVNLWTSNSVTMSNENSVVGLYNKDAVYKNWLLGNVKGKLVVVDVGEQTESPNNEDISVESTSSNVSVYELLHTGNLGAEVFPILDSVVRRTGEGDVAVNGLNVSAPLVQVAPTHILAGVGIGPQNGAGTRYLPYPISSLSSGASVDPTPVGTVVTFAGLSIPTGWLSCTGSALLSTTYPILFGIISHAYGGSGTTFNLPDLRGEFVRGLDLGRGVDSGRANGSFQPDAYKNHDHNYTTVAIDINFTASGLQILPGTLFYGSHPNVETGNNQYHHNTDMSGGNGVGVYGDHDFGQPVLETRPRNVAMRYIIKVD